MLLDLGVIVFLTSSVNKDCQIETHAYRDDILHLIEIGHVLTMNRTAQQDQLIGSQTSLACQHGDTATMTVRKKAIQSVHIVRIGPVNEILGSELTC